MHTSHAPSSTTPQTALHSRVNHSSVNVSSDFNVSIAYSPVSSTTSHSCTSNNTPNAFELWHNRLGHASKTIVSHILHHCKIPFSNKMTIDLCKACCLEKAHRLPFLPSPNTYSSPLELVYTDLWGPAPVLSPQGYCNYIVLLMLFLVSLGFTF